MLGKRMHQSKGRLTSKAYDNGNPAIPGPSNISKPGKETSTVAGGKGSKNVCTIPHLRVKDNAVNVPRCAAAAMRPVDEPLRVDDLDGVQQELESLLGITALKVRHFHAKIDKIVTNESKRKKILKAAGKKMKCPDNRKFQDDLLTKTKEHAELSNQPKMPKVKNVSNIDALYNFRNPEKQKRSQLSKSNDQLAHKFWNYVEPFCAPVSLADINFLESLLQKSSNTTMPPIPPLGRHYSEVWSDEHLAEEQNASNPNRQRSMEKSPDFSHLRKKFEKPNDVMSGPLTQRLVSALMEENILPYEVPEKMKQSTCVKNTYKNSLTLEKCLRKELVEQGILDPEDLPPLTDPVDDEILAEIKKCQIELAAVRKGNCRKLKHLIAISKQETIRIKLKKELEVVDEECIDIYKKMVAAKQKKRPITKEEKEHAWKAIKEQTRLNKEISALPQTGPYTD